MILFVTMPYGVELLVCIGIGGCGWPISDRVCLICVAILLLMNSAPSLASAVDDMVCLVICAMLQIASLLGGKVVSVGMKKCPPALFLAFGSHRYEASLWMARIILLAWYVMMASLFMAA